MKTYTINNKTYDFYVNFDVEDGKTISDYAYFQHTDEIVAGIADADDEWSYCSAAALAQCLSLYYNDTSIVPMDFMSDFNNGFNWGNDSSLVESLGRLYGTVDSDDINNTGYVGSCEGFVNDESYKNINADNYAANFINSTEMSDYLDEIIASLKVGRPVIISVFRYEWKAGILNPTTHYVTIVGVKGGVDLNNACYTDFVMLDPGTQLEKKISTLDNTYKGYTYYPYNYRIITPYLIDCNGDFILDENGRKTTDPQYAQVVENVDTGEGMESDEEIIEDLEKYLEEMPVGKAALDKELNVAIGIIYEEGSTRASKFVRIFNGEGKQLAHLNGVNATIDDISNWTIKNIVVNKEKGTWSFDMIHTNSNGAVSKSTPSGYSAYLIGYGSEGHTFSAISLQE